MFVLVVDPRSLPSSVLAAPTTVPFQPTRLAASVAFAAVMSLIYSPGPAAYDLGSGIGKAPAASMKGRYKDPDTSKSPGPGLNTQRSDSAVKHAESSEGGFDSARLHANIQLR